MNKLYSKEQIEEWASKRADDAGRLSRQLLYSMRDNERLRGALMNASYTLEALGDKEAMKRIEKALSYKDSVISTKPSL